MHSHRWHRAPAPATPQPDAAVIGFSASTAVAAATQLYLRNDGEIGNGTDNHALNLGVPHHAAPAARRNSISRCRAGRRGPVPQGRRPSVNGTTSDRWLT
jgi:hypothetical protein